jgi:host factor-I protein
MAKPSINIQDGFLFHSLRSGVVIAVQLITGERLEGTLKRFDRFAIILDLSGLEVMVYKHGIVSIEGPAGAEPEPPVTEPQT